MRSVDAAEQRIGPKGAGRPTDGSARQRATQRRNASAQAGFRVVEHFANEMSSTMRKMAAQVADAFRQT